MKFFNFFIRRYHSPALWATPILKRIFHLIWGTFFRTIKMIGTRTVDTVNMKQTTIYLRNVLQLCALRVNGSVLFRLFTRVDSLTDHTRISISISKFIFNFNFNCSFDGCHFCFYRFKLVDPIIFIFIFIFMLGTVRHF